MATFSDMVYYSLISRFSENEKENGILQ